MTLGVSREGPRIVRVRRPGELPRALTEMGLESDRPVFVSIGGAGRMDPEHAQAVSRFLTRHLVPVLDRWGVTVVDGGTDAGLMRAMGRARHDVRARFPLVGVAAQETVLIGDDDEPPDGRAPLEPHHTHVVLVPGDSWGDESPWVSHVASAIAGRAASVTLLVNGGEISYDDAERSLSAGRPLLVAEGTGRTADAIATASRGRAQDARARTIAASPLTRVVPLTPPETMIEAVADALSTVTEQPW